VRRGRSRPHTASRGVSPSPSRRAESCASALRAIKYLEVHGGAPAGGWVGAVLQDQEAKRIAAPRRKRKWSVRPTGSEAGAMVVSWLWMLLRPAAVRRVPPGRLTALLSWVLFLSSYPILMGRLRRRRINSSGVRVRSIVSQRIDTVAFGTHTVDALLLLVCGLRHQEEMGFCGHIERLQIS
jgi:hypothetical protein